MIERTAPAAHALVLSAPDRRALVHRAKLLALGRDRVALHRVRHRPRCRHRRLFDRPHRIRSRQLGRVSGRVHRPVALRRPTLLLRERRAARPATDRDQLFPPRGVCRSRSNPHAAIRTLIAGDHPEASWVGIGLAAFTAPTMPLLALAKRRVGNRLGSAATVQEGVQNMVCAYLSVALLVGLLANALFSWWWADPAAALFVAAVAAREGRESWRGEGCCDTC